ncbi:hypothetical protein [Dyadobacter jiangsuensis]|uniref:Uncharacterized protein n=1 Tax=Dyadobacter jiangsuensis TaxID=1591085 RepID=A0A2P8F8L8_9BACT|nr:hypothetical protein [Dyadobacter jiangsuensis]PSL18070.1 hypothetical protein CLV60_13318 [Dyadobacter jiangsuensis]
MSLVEGKLQIEGEVIHVVVRRCYDMSPLLRQLNQKDEDPDVMTLSRADEKMNMSHNLLTVKPRLEKSPCNWKYFLPAVTSINLYFQPW